MTEIAFVEPYLPMLHGNVEGNTDIENQFLTLFANNN